MICEALDKVSNMLHAWHRFDLDLRQCRANTTLSCKQHDVFAGSTTPKASPPPAPRCKPSTRLHAAAAHCPSAWKCACHLRHIQPKPHSGQHTQGHIRCQQQLQQQQQQKGLCNNSSASQDAAHAFTDTAQLPCHLRSCRSLYSHPCHRACRKS